MRPTLWEGCSFVLWCIINFPIAKAASALMWLRACQTTPDLEVLMWPSPQYLNRRFALMFSLTFCLAFSRCALSLGPNFSITSVCVLSYFNHIKKLPLFSLVKRSKLKSLVLVLSPQPLPTSQTKRKKKQLYKAPWGQKQWIRFYSALHPQKLLVQWLASSNLHLISSWIAFEGLSLAR